MWLSHSVKFEPFCFLVFCKYWSWKFLYIYFKVAKIMAFTSGFPAKCGYLSTGLPNIGILCIGLHCWLGYLPLWLPLLLLWWLLVAACIIACVILCSAAFLSFFYWDFPMLVCLFSIFSQPYVWLLSFYFWHDVMLLTLRADNTTGSFWLCHLFYMLSVIYVHMYICKRVHLYIQLWYVQMA